MQLPFDVFATCDEELLLRELTDGHSVESKNTPIRLAMNISKEIVCIVALPNADVCLGPFEGNGNGLDEAIYDGIHYLSVNGLIDRYTLKRLDDASIHGQCESLAVAIRTRRALLVEGDGHDWVITPTMKTEDA